MTTRRGAALALVAALAITCLPAQAGTPLWVPTVPVQTGAQERIEVTSDSAWAVIDHSRVLRSTDQGLTWRPVNPVPVSGLPLSGPVLGGSSDTAVAPLSAQVALGANGNAVSRTVDGGTSWQRVTVPSVTSPAGLDGADLLRRTGSRYWLAPGGFDIVNDCARPLRSTPLLSSADGVRWTRADLAPRSGIVSDLKFLDSRTGAASVYEFTWMDVNDSDGCGFTGSSGTSGVYLTGDGGRTWRRATTCTPACSLDWTSAGVLTLGKYDGVVLDSRDRGRTFRRTADLATTPQALGLQALDCAGLRCFAMVNGGGIWRRDGSGEWTNEPSDADAPGLCLAGIAAVDARHAIAAGPHALLSRQEAGVATAGSAPSRPAGAVVVGPGKLRDGAVLTMTVRHGAGAGH